MRTEGAILGKPLFAAAAFTQFAQFYALAIIDTFNIKCDKEQNLFPNICSAVYSFNKTTWLQMKFQKSHFVFSEYYYSVRSFQL